jgi:hypothetical protein
MPKAMRPVVKIEDGAGGGLAEEGRQEEADAGGERQRRRVNDAGDAVSAEAGLMYRANAELQAQAIQGMERTRLQGEELQLAKVRIAELAAEVKMRDEALQAKKALMQTVTKSKDDLLLCKDALLQAKDAEIRLLHADVAQLSAQAAAAGAAPPPAPAPAAARAAVASAEAVFQEGQRLYGEQRFSEAAERWGRAALLVGACYEDGCGGVAQDYAEAVRLYRLAAEQGHADAQFFLGSMFEKGQGVAKKRAEAIRWYRLAAAQGNANATAALKRLGV